MRAYLSSVQRSRKLLSGGFVRSRPPVFRERRFRRRLERLHRSSSAEVWRGGGVTLSYENPDVNLSLGLRSRGTGWRNTTAQTGHAKDESRRPASIWRARGA